MVSIYLDIDIRELVQNITTSLTREELFDFIKEIDATIAEYDFTEKLRDYFVSEMEKEDEYMKEEVDEN